jgi:hypothetical protein
LKFPTIHKGYLCIEENIDTAVCLYLFDKSGQILLNVISPPGLVEESSLSAKDALLFDQIGPVPLIGQIPGRHHTRDAAPYYQGSLIDLKDRLNQGLQ